MIIPIEEITALSLLYHINSEPWLNIEAYQGDGYEVEYKTMAGPGDARALPAPQETPLMKLIRSRESCRQYQPRTMSQGTLSTLLAGGYGVSRLSQLPDSMSVLFRTVPSAGALYPLELYIVTENVEELPDGLHHYKIRDHALELIKDKAEAAELRNALLTEPFIQNANLVIYLAAVFARTQKKYGPRGYRYILFEAGHVAQNICLLAAEQGLGSLCMGGFIDSKLNRLLGLDGAHEAVVYSVAVGHLT
ncbi:MAG TPA: SagB/ThcOx family dehydrogenase [Pyrinomonadaceae bacterium]|nr:SagB/ThcOx family dehydrogenase [Pyrinomonadaceae bacterium]